MLGLQQTNQGLGTELDSEAAVNGITRPKCGMTEEEEEEGNIVLLCTCLIMMHGE